MLKIPRGTPGTVFACLTTVCSFFSNSGVELDSIEFNVRGELVYILRPRFLSVQGPWSSYRRKFEKGNVESGSYPFIRMQSVLKAVLLETSELGKTAKGRFGYRCESSDNGLSYRNTVQGKRWFIRGILQDGPVNVLGQPC